ncbi:MAG TPA: hypothetical protein PKH30_02540 [Actinomycetota bacterium]|nr:hypothetical protein [Actinomycetota bacterium]HNO15005.1 hypothetical protein [Actinomycetota bacterium]
MRQWPAILATFVLVGGALVWYVASIPVRYASTSVVAFQPEPDRADGRDLVSLLVQTYPEFVASQTVVDAAANAAGVSPGELRGGLDAEIPPLTLTMQITTELPDALQAQVANQALVDQVVAQGKKDPYLAATAVSNADLPESPAGVSKKLLYLLSLVLAAGVALVVGIFAARLRTPHADA